MSRFFDMDSPVMTALSRVCDLMLLNLLTLVCCIPIVTIGASVTAMHYVELKWARDEEGYILRPFFREFKNNFKQATAEWLIILAVGILLGVDLYVVTQSPDMFPDFMVYVIGAAAIVAFLVVQWIFLLQCHFYNTVRQTFKNSFIMAIAQFPRTLVMALCWIVSFLLFYLSLVTELQVIFPLVLLFFLSVPGYLCCKLASKPFAAFEPEEEEITEEESEAEKEEAYRILTEESAVRRKPAPAPQEKKEEGTAVEAENETDEHEDL